MKNLYLIFIITLIIITGISVNTVGQTKTATDKSEKIYMNKKGEIRDHGWNKIGFITKDNIVKNSRGKNIFFIDRNGSVIDVNGKNLGKAQKNGNYLNVNGENIINVMDIMQKHAKSSILKDIQWVPFIEIISFMPVLLTVWH